MVGGPPFRKNGVRQKNVIRLGISAKRKQDVREEYGLGCLSLGARER